MKLFTVSYRVIQLLERRSQPSNIDRLAKIGAADDCIQVTNSWPAGTYGKTYLGCTCTSVRVIPLLQHIRLVSHSLPL